jgi:hypothetical protein
VGPPCYSYIQSSPVNRLIKPPPCYSYIQSSPVNRLIKHATFNNISVISWRSVLFVAETVVPRENHQAVASHLHTLSHYVVSDGLLDLTVYMSNMVGVL